MVELPVKELCSQCLLNPNHMGVKSYGKINFNHLFSKTMENQIKPSIVVKTAESAVKQDKNGKNYKTVTYEKFGQEVIQDEILGTIVAEGAIVSTAVNAYQESYLNGLPEPGYNQPIFDAKAPKNGGAFLGDIVTREVPAYSIDIKNIMGEVTGSRTVNSYKTVVFGDTRKPAEFELAVRAAFRSAGHALTPEDAELMRQAAERKAARSSVGSGVGPKF